MSGRDGQLLAQGTIGAVEGKEIVVKRCRILGLVSGSEFPQWKAGVPMLKLAIPT